MKKYLYSLLITTVFVMNVRADEGMWLLTLLEDLNISTMRSMGCNLSAEEIYSIDTSSLKDAIVIFGRGCTGEIISDEGLLLTNHHCGYDQIQMHSAVEHNYLKDGFWAKSKGEELPNPDLTVKFLVSITDVTDSIIPLLSDTLTEEERESKIDELAQALEDTATIDNHYIAKVKSLFGGNMYYMFLYEEYLDVRLVGAPPSSIGKYGADTDNWMWPRHTGDFSLFRVYTDSAGSPAEYSENNIPLKPKKYLPISIKGIEKGDFAMILGNPGSTDRYITSYEIEELLDVTHPNRIKIRELRQEVLLDDMMTNEAIRIKYSSKYSRSSNYWKFSIGQQKGLKKMNIADKKFLEEADFTEWVQADSLRKEEYGEALQLMQEAVSKRKESEHVLQYIEESLMMGSDAIGFVILNLYTLMQENSLDEATLIALTDKLRREAKDFFRDFYKPTGIKVTAAMLELYYGNVDESYHPDFYKKIIKRNKADYKGYISKIYEKSIFVDERKFNAFLNDPDVKTIEKDPLYKIAKQILYKYYQAYFAMQEYGYMYAEGHRLYIKGLQEMHPDRKFYPDANFTMRLTYGTVGDYSPGDAVQYDYITTLKGVMEKEEPDNWEFIVPGKLKELYQAKDYSPYVNDTIMPVCFTTNTDITGGNSGSPVINGNGELIGLAFDGNWEAMTGDIIFDNNVQKTISVDIRYVLFIIDKFADAKNIIDELEIIEN